MSKKKPNRSGFYVVVLTMFFISISLFVYAENGLKIEENEDQADLSGFISIEISHIPHGTQTLMRAFLPSTSEAYAAQAEIQNLKDSFDSIILSTSDDGTKIEVESNDTDVPDDEIVLVERAVAWQEYVVKQGETLSEIVGKFSGISLQDVIRANELGDADRVVGKQILLIPLGEEFVEDTLEEVRIRKARVIASRTELQPIEVKTYVVREGDSLWSIANEMDLELDTLVGSNNNLGTVLKVETTLRIPNQDGIFYTIKAGDSAKSISGKFKVSFSSVQMVNKGVDMDSLKPGDEIFLPGARPEEPEPAKKPAKSSQSSKPSGKNESSGSSGGGSFRWPVAGKITSPFGWRKHPITRRNDFHGALDIKAPHGSPIRASRAGTVVYAGWQSGYGKTVVVDHGGGLSTLYAHCSSTLVKKGQSVSTSTVIARIGATGRATGPHVHFEIRSNNRAVNPLSRLK